MNVDLSLVVEVPLEEITFSVRWILQRRSSGFATWKGRFAIFLLR